MEQILVENYIFSIGYLNDLGFQRLDRVQMNFQTQFGRLFRSSDLWEGTPDPIGVNFKPTFS